MDDMESILSWIEEIGGGYVWEPEIFAVTLMEVSVTDQQAQKICQLRGVQQLAVNAQVLSFSAIASLAGIAGLQSLALGNCAISSEQFSALQKAVSGVAIELA